MAKYLRECLDSIIAQELKSIEIIAVNDGSTDESLKILCQYQKLYSNLIIINQFNQGAGVAKNVGLKKVRGKYVTFMDPDDYYPNSYCLEALYNAAEKQQVNICSGVLIENHRGIRTRKFQIKVENTILENCIIKTKEYDEIYGYTRYIYRAEFLHREHIFFPPYRRYEEESFTIKALAEAGVFFAISTEVYEHRIGYKRQDYPLEICFDILRGIRDAYQMVEKYDLRKMYENRLKNIFQEYVLPFFRFSYMGYAEIDEILQEINEIIVRWVKDDHLFTEEIVLQYREQSINEYETLKRLVEKKNSILIYGAGLNTNVFLEMFPQCTANIIGIAVTKKTTLQESKIANFEVKPINDFFQFHEQVTVLVTAAPQYWREIQETLVQYQFNNVQYIDVRKMELAVALLKGRL